MKKVVSDPENLLVDTEAARLDAVVLLKLSFRGEFALHNPIVFFFAVDLSAEAKFISTTHLGKSLDGVL